MPNQFNLYQAPVKLAHAIWSQVLSIGDLAIDATCGNGYDTVHLAHLCLNGSKGSLIGFDIQELAITNTKNKITTELSEDQAQQIKLINCSHMEIEAYVAEESATLIVYNLGYLPGGDKSVTTKTENTLESVAKSLPLVKIGGAISITCYPGHPEGLNEQKALLDFTYSLDPKEWSVVHHTWQNRKTSPSLLFLERSF